MGCHLCPRECNADRSAGERGYCGETDVLRLSRASLHKWEEPCICTGEGAGTIFFTGCALKCIYCQNSAIALGDFGKEVSCERLADICLDLQDQGACNIDLVTPSHFVPQIVKALTIAKNRGLTLPVVYNSSGYEKADTLKMCEGLVDIYLPDCKYASAVTAEKFSHAPDYFTVAQDALREMFRQVGPVQFADSPATIGDTGRYNAPPAAVGDTGRFTDSPETVGDFENTAHASISGPSDSSDTSPVLKRGMIVRHLVLPGHSGNSRRVLKWLHEEFGNDIYVSIMSQYTPMRQFPEYPELSRSLAAEEYDKIIDFCLSIGMENAFIQEGAVASESFIPDFDGRGV